MKRKWHEGRYGVESLAPSSEFLPRKNRTKVYDLGEFGVPTVPVIGQTSHRRPDEPSGWHVHKGCVEFICCTSGSCEYESGGRRHCLKPGMMFVSRAEEAHRQLDCPKGYSSLYMLFKPAGDRTSRWFGTAVAKLPRLFTCGRTIPMRFGRIFSMVEGNRPREEARIRLQTETRALLLDILDSTALTVRKGRSDALDGIAERMRNHPECEYPIERLVEECGMSKASFMELFKKTFGRPPYAYLLCCRVDAAKALLRKGTSEKVVADRLGFTTAQNFVRTFRNFVGVTPKRWLSLE